jgi:hypothetical protein
MNKAYRITCVISLLRDHISEIACSHVLFQVGPTPWQRGSLYWKRSGSDGADCDEDTCDGGALDVEQLHDA